MKKILLTLALFCSIKLLYAQHEHGPGSVVINSEAFTMIKSLAGDWKGNYQWIGSSAKGEMNAKYYLTGNGTAVVEDLVQNGNIIMTTVYHQDGNTIRATHFCAAGNQPRLRADSVTHKDNSINFDFVDITNLTSKDAAHVRALSLIFQNNNSLTITFLFTQAGVDHIERIDLHRS